MAEAPTTATIIFTDLVGSTALRARLGEERADDLRRIHDEMLTARIEAHGGRVVRPQGDGLMAAFPAASDALTAAVEMQQAIDRYNRSPDALAELSMRVGLSTGDVSWEGGECFGTPVVEAARLEAAAEGGQILCSDFVRMMARGRGGHEFRDLGFLEAVPADGAARAYRYTLLAAERASRLLAHDEAAEAYGRALELLDEVEGEGPLTRCELLLARGKAQRQAGDFASAQRTLRAAAEEAAARGAAELLARAAIAHEDAGWLPGFFGAESVELLRRARAMLPPDDNPLRALTVASLSRALEFSGRQAEGIEQGEEALAMARRLDDPATTTAVLWRTSLTHLRVEHAPLMADQSRELRAMARELGDDELYVYGSAFALIVAGQLGDLEAFDEVLSECSREVEQLRQPLWEHILTQCRYFRAVLAGDLALAEHQLELAKDLSQTRGWDTEGMHGLGMFLLRREQGRLAGLATALRTMVRLNPASLWRPGLAALYAELGMAEEARAEFECLAADGFAAVPHDGTRPLCLCLLAEVCCALDDAERASWLLKHLRHWEGRLLVFWGNLACLGPADRLLGLLAATAGRPAEAEHFLERSLELSRRIDSPVWVAHCLYDLARLLHTSDPARARSMLAEAAELCERYGLAGLGQRVATSRA